MTFYTLKDREDKLLYKLAEWHNQTPKLWMPAYKPGREEILETVLRMKQDCFIGLAEDEYIVGFIWAEVQGKDVMILSLYVEEGYRNRGIAGVLKKDLEHWCKQKGIKKIKTTVHSINEKMLALNKKLGYEATMIHMEKKI